MAARETEPAETSMIDGLWWGCHPTNTPLIMDTCDP
jgi:hypothetical protein